MSSCDVSVCPVGHRDEEEEKISIDFSSQCFKKSNYFVFFFTFYYFLEENILFNYNLDVIFFLVPNCPFYYVGAKLSWCQIVWCLIVHFYYVDAKLSPYWAVTAVINVLSFRKYDVALPVKHFL